jgi:hypothetical protein
MTMPELKESLQSLADRRAAESSGDFDAVVTTAAARRRRRTGTWSAMVAAAVAVGVVVALAPWQHKAAPEPVAKPPNPIVVTPETAKPGQLVALTFPQSSPRGVAFQLTTETAPDRVLYYLTSDWGRPSGEHRPTWTKPEGGYGWVDVGINGPGPERVIVPDTIEAGRYRICTANAAPQVCGLLIVAR